MLYPTYPLCLYIFVLFKNWPVFLIDSLLVLANCCSEAPFTLSAVQKIAAPACCSDFPQTWQMVLAVSPPPPSPTSHYIVSGTWVYREYCHAMPNQQSLNTAKKQQASPGLTSQSKSHASESQEPDPLWRARDVSLPKTNVKICPATHLLCVI